MTLASVGQRRGLALVAWVPIASYVWVALNRLRYPYELEWLEGGAVELVRRVSEGQSLYVSPSFDFTPWPYPPLYFWVSAGVAEVTGEGFVPLRLVSLLSSVASLVLIAAIVRQAGGDRLAGLTAAGLFAATFQLGGAWLDLARVDSLFLALFLAAVLVGVRAKSWRGGLLVGGLLFLSFLTKQNALIAAVPMLAWLLAFRRMVGLSAAATLVVSVVGSVLVGNATTDGWYDDYVVKELLGQPVEWRWLWGFWFIDLALPLAICLTIIGRWAYRRQIPRRSMSLHRALVRCYVPAVALGMLAASWAGRLHSGGFANVVIPAYAAIALLFGLAVSGVLTGRDAGPRFTAGWLLAVTSVQILLLLVLPWRGTLLWSLVPTVDDRAAGDRLVTLLGDLPGRVIIPVHPHLLTQAGRPTHSHSLAVGDVIRGPEGRGKDALRIDLATSLDDVSVVILDTPGEVSQWEPALSRDFTAVPPGVFEAVVYGGDAEVFRPVTDLPIRPTYVYVRTSDLASVQEVLTR